MVITRQPPAVISIHAPRAGGDDRGGAGKRLYERFQSTPPVRGATFLTRHTSQEQKFQSTPPVRGATGDHPRRRSRRHRISIHAPRAGGDAGREGVSRHAPDISIHAPRAGGDTRSTRSQRSAARFQSTSPVRGATLRINPLYYILAISIHAPRAGGDIFISSPSSSGGISIHAPRAGGDLTARAPTSLIPYFNPRPPCGGRLL